jgi:hypothetical protein
MVTMLSVNARQDMEPRSGLEKVLASKLLFCLDNDVGLSGMGSA